MQVELSCPYCGEPLTFVIDETGGKTQVYIEDCAVCCEPIEVRALRRQLAQCRERSRQAGRHLQGVQAIGALLNGRVQLEVVASDLDRDESRIELFRRRKLRDLRGRLRLAYERAIRQDVLGRRPRTGGKNERARNPEELVHLRWPRTQALCTSSGVCAGQAETRREAVAERDVLRIRARVGRQSIGTFVHP